MGTGRRRRDCSICGTTRKTQSEVIPYVCRTCLPVRPKKKAPRRVQKSRPMVKASIIEEEVEDRSWARGDNTPDRRDHGQRQRDAAEAWRRKVTSKVRDIGSDGDRDLWAERLQAIDWDSRLRAQEDLQFFSETYLPAVFFLGWSNDQRTALRKIESVFLDGGMFSLAMPRGGGKTALCRSGTIWGTANAHRRFPFLVGSSQPKALQTLDFIRTYWYRSPLLRRDFPEIGYPVDRLENRYHLASGQTFRGVPTFVEWSKESVRYPCLIFGERDRDLWISSARRSSRKAGTYAENFLQEVVDPDTGNPSWITRNSGIIIRTSGIDGSIRGDAEVHPVTLEQPRPDVVLLDDIQKDQKADSPASCEKLLRLIDGAVQGLAGPGQTISALMPCTVIREGDVSDTYLDREQRPEWRGERCRMVLSWPEGLTDYEITLDTRAGELWNQYADLRIQSLRLHEDIRLASEFYLENREEMDQGFEVSWPDRYDQKKEHSATQHAMNLRLSSPSTFPAEYQNQGRRTDQKSADVISAKALAAKVIDLDRGELDADHQTLVSFIDIQNEILFWGVFATAPNFTGTLVDYGTWPEVSSPIFTKAQAESWSLLTKAFFDRYPEHRDKAIRTETGKIRAPIEAKIYNALSQVVPWLLSRQFTRRDAISSHLRIQRVGIDARWGQITDVVKRYARESGHSEVLPCFGTAFPPTHRQLEEYTRTRGWLFEDQVNPQVKEVKWVMKPDPSGQFSLQVDASRMKDFLMARLGTPMGAPSSVTLFRGTPDDHALLASHVSESEYPEPVTARGMTKNLWKLRDGRPDNDFLDVFCNCLALASLQGTFLPLDGSPQVKDSRAYQKRRTRGRLSERYNDKNRRRR